MFGDEPGVAADARAGGPLIWRASYANKLPQKKRRALLNAERIKR
jgi:hypothetical protein